MLIISSFYNSRKITYKCFVLLFNTYEVLNCRTILYMLGLEVVKLSDILKKIGDRIRLIRKEKGLSQEKLAELANIHTNFLGGIERGERNTTVESLVKVTSALGITMEELFRYAEPMNEEDDLQKTIDLLLERPSEDHALAFGLLRSVFEWEKEKR
jgi:transcriptional regulator with XRE-family HTH domain